MTYWTDSFREAAILFVKNFAKLLHGAQGGRKQLIMAVPPALPSAYGKVRTQSTINLCSPSFFILTFIQWYAY